MADGLISPDGPLNVGIIGDTGATPLETDDLAGLIPTFVATRADLNLVEFENITRALPWARAQARERDPAELFEYTFLFELHKRMFGDVWRWAGTARRRETNLGVDPVHVPEQTRAALDDAAYWHGNETFGPDERAVRVHHRLVSIHPFPNGNGRTTRLMADLYLISIGNPAFTWGQNRSGRPEEVRDDYLAALRAVTQDECEALIQFARS